MMVAMENIDKPLGLQKADTKLAFILFFSFFLDFIPHLFFNEAFLQPV